MESTYSWLLEPISEELPCGENLEDTQLLASFDGYRVFGQMTPLGAETDWREIRDAAEEALQKSKDFRLLANYAVARLQVDGFEPFSNLLEVAASWLESFPDHVYPLIDDDAILRRNSLNNFSDRMAVLDAIRRTPFVRHQGIGAFSLRDLEIAKGNLKLPEGEESSGANEAQIAGALAAIDAEQVQRQATSFEQAIAALKQIDTLMRDRHGYESAPDFSALLVPLQQIHGLFAEQLAARAAMAAVYEGDGAESGAARGGAGGAVIGVGSIRSRDDAARALDAVAEFFRRNEPSSPVPMMVERAKRLIAMDFLAVLAELAPDGLAGAKHIGGVRDDE